MKYGKAVFSYPHSWRMTSEKKGQVTLVSVTPDSMKNLTMKMVEVFDLPTDAEHNFAFFKKNFTMIIQSTIGTEGKILKTQETTFKEHKTMYAEAISSSLPIKVYGVNAGAHICVVILTQRRYSQIPDPAMERDEAAILNSFKFED